jgi:cytosine/adenosine deaminase-related metal-dependent hydrolase
MLGEARQALLAHRVEADAERWLSAEEVLWMATRGGARCLGRDDIGSLEPGKAADVVLIDTRRLSYAGAGSDLLAALVFSPWPEPVHTALVNGRVVVASGEIAGLDVPALVARADAISDDLLRRASRSSGRDYFAQG